MKTLETHMKVCFTAVLSALVLCSSGSPVQAQAPAAIKKPAAPTGKAKESLEAQFARQNFKQVLDAVNNAWFGKAYANINAVALDGTLSINLNAAAMNAKVDQLGQGAVKGGLTKNANVNLTLKSTYFANGNFRTELNGDFGNLLYYRMGDQGFLYSKEQNAWTGRVDPRPADAPLTFLGWFRQCINDIQKVYVDGSTFKASLGKGSADSNTQTLIFATPTGPYDPKKREQSMAESLGFWKRGRLEVVFDKASKLPHQMNYSNESQGVFTRMSFSYNPGGKLNNVTIANQSKGMEGPASLTLGYDEAGLINHLAGQMGFSQGSMRFDLALAFKNLDPNSIRTTAPVLATRKGREELETLLLVNLAGKVLDLQKSGFNLRSVTLANK